MAIRIIIAEDHPTVRAGIRSLLKLFPQFELVAEAVNGVEAVRKTKQLMPDIVLMDISMPRMDGLTAAAQIHKLFPKVRVIMLSLHTQSYHVRQALEAGVSGYLLKNLADELEPALRAVAAGKTFFSPAIAQHLPSDARKTKKSLLTPRQQEILKLIAKGSSTKEVASKLAISVKTAQTHRSELMNRLDIHDVAGLVRYAIRTGLVSSDK